MTDLDKPLARHDKIHAVRWDPDDWDRIVQATQLFAAQEHLDLGEADLIRKGVRMLLDTLLGPAGSTDVASAIAEQRTGQDRRRVG